MGQANEAEIERMMDDYGDMLLRLCAGILGDVHLAQDAAQDTFVKAYRYLDDFRRQHEGSERAWLTRIAVNTCRDYRRMAWFRMVDRRVPVEAVGEAERMDEGDEEVLSAVRRLPGPCREAVLLHYYEDMPAQEMAEVLGVTRSTVYRRLERAKRLLRASLERRETHE